MRGPASHNPSNEEKDKGDNDWDGPTNVPNQHADRGTDSNQPFAKNRLRIDGGRCVVTTSVVNHSLRAKVILGNEVWVCDHSDVPPLAKHCCAV